MGDLDEKTPLLTGNGSAAGAQHHRPPHTLVNLPRQESVLDVKGHVMSCHNTTYSVPVGARCKPKTPKVILDNVSGVFRPGMNALMGPTGSGKSSLLDVLAGRKDPTGLQGLVLVDGQPQPKNFKCMSGYVLQEDIIMGTLTVRENLTFSANLRLPSHNTNREEKVNEVLRELGLTEVADSKVGTEFLRGISGGEKKRCAIGMELITSPGVLFLDEPTTGLDASTANAVMALLWRLGRAGRTIIFSIHQPRYSIFRLFDSLVLLGAGKLVYQGPAAEALEYFSGLGYQCEEHNNPADFLLDVVNGDSTALQSIGQANLISRPTDGEGVIDNLIEQYSRSKWNRQREEEGSAILEKYLANSTGAVREVIAYNTGFFTQLRYVSQRALLSISRNPQASVMQVLTMIIFSLIVGALYYNVEDTTTNGLQNRVGSFFFIIMNMVFSNMSAVELFIKEKRLFIHENVSGYYRVSAYFIAKVMCDTIPMRILPVSVFAAIAYFLIGYNVTTDQFFTFLATLLMVALSSTAMTFLISASIRIFAVATLCLAMSFVLMLIFGGLLVNLATIGDWLEWLKYLSLFRYGLNALSINELHGLELCEYAVNGTLIRCGKDFAENYLTTFLGIEEAGEPWTLWQNHVALGVMTVVFFILTYIQLRRVKKLT